jgi:hypothetical protein
MKYPMPSLRKFSPAFMLTWLSVALSSPMASGTELQSLGFSAPNECSAQLSTANRAPCRDLLIQVQALRLTDAPPDIGQWRLVRTPGPAHEPDIVSIMHTADALKSDPDFAGLMIRCREKTTLQIGLIVIRPFPPRAHPRVVITSGHTRAQTEAAVLPGGIMLSLPNESSVLAKGPWQSLDHVSFAIEGDGVMISGIVPLENLSAALAFLQSNCPDQ